MYNIYCEIEFDAAHYLEKHKGKCRNIHDHRYKIIAKVGSNKLGVSDTEKGMVMDFAEIKNELKNIAEIFDHKFIIENSNERKKLSDSIRTVINTDIVFVDYRPTPENMAKDIFHILKNKIKTLKSITVFETSNNSCEYTEENENN